MPDTPFSVFPPRVLQKPWAASSGLDSFLLKHSSPETLSGQNSLACPQNISATQSPLYPEKTGTLWLSPAGSSDSADRPG